MDGDGGANRKEQGTARAGIFQALYENPDGAFLFLGFRSASVPLSPSLDFLRRFCGLFAHKLSQIPDLESIRHDVSVAFIDEERDHALMSAPLMTGAEYLSPAVLDDIWQRLHAEFRREIRQYRGTVEEFVQQYSEIHREWVEIVLKTTRPILPQFFLVG